MLEVARKRRPSRGRPVGGPTTAAHFVHMSYMIQPLMPTSPNQPKSKRGRKPGGGKQTTLRIPPPLKERAHQAIAFLALTETGGPKDFTAYVVRALELQIERDIASFREKGGKLPGE